MNVLYKDIFHTNTNINITHTYVLQIHIFLQEALSRLNIQVVENSLKI